MTHATSRNSKAGFTLIELVIVLGITGLIFSGLWGLLTSGSTALQAQSAAQQYRQVIEATRKYATSGAYDGQPAGPVATPPTIATYQGAGVNLLPSTFSATDAYGNAITIGIEIIDATKQQFRFVVYAGTKTAAPTVAVPDKVGAQIASLIGSEGGFVYGNATDGCSTAGTATSTACGSFNSFALPLSAFGILAGRGRVVAMGYTIDTNAGTAPWLYRKAGIPPEQNTMQQPMFFSPGLSLSMAGSLINMGATAGATTGGGQLLVSGGKVIMNGGNFSMGTDAATTGGGTLYMGAGAIADLATMTGNNVAITFNSMNFTLTNGGIFRLPGANGITITPTNPSIIAFDINGIGRATEFQAQKFIYGASDITMKENLVPITDALQKVLQLKGYTFDWKGSHTHDVGLVAQDVQKVFPELITRLNNDKLGVDYAKIVAPLVEAVRQLKTENDELKKKMDSLEQKLKTTH